MKTVTATVTVDVRLKKQVTFEIFKEASEEQCLDEAVEVANRTKVTDFFAMHGWSISTSRLPEAELDGVEETQRGNPPYSVDAGRYDGNDENCKYSDAFATMDEALEAFDKCQGYPWQRLSYKGRVLMGVEP